MFELKPLTPDGVEAALDRAEHYRLLNQAWDAESICRDVLDLEPDNRRAIITLILALTDQFNMNLGSEVSAARTLLTRLESQYDRDYYEGLICERRGKAVLGQGAPDERRGRISRAPALHEARKDSLDWPP